MKVPCPTSEDFIQQRQEQPSLWAQQKRNIFFFQVVGRVEGAIGEERSGQEEGEVAIGDRNPSGEEPV